MKSDKMMVRATLLKIITYVVVMSLYESVGADRFGELGRFLTAGALLLLLALDLHRRRDRFSETPLGKLPYGNLLYLLPMLAVATANLWHGAVLRFSRYI